MAIDPSEFDAFLSHNQAQKSWARELVGRLRDLGARIFFDEDSIQLGEDVSAAIERGIRRSRHVLLVVSPAALASPWVALELSMGLHRDPNAATRSLIPILREDCELPLSLARLKCLDARDGDMNAHVEALVKALALGVRGKGTSKLLQAEATPRTEPDKLRRQFHAGGPLPRDAIYVERDGDAELQAILREDHGLAVIWGPHQIGKSSLARRALRQMQDRGYRIAFIDLCAFGRIGSLPDLYMWVADHIASELQFDLPNRSQFLSDDGASGRFASYLLGLPLPAVVAFDEVDALQGRQRTEFFSMVRAVHHMQGMRRKRSLFLLFFSFLPSSSFTSRKGERATISPFNIGRDIRLRPFSRAQTADLLRHCRHVLVDADIDNVFSLTGGQPFLVQEMAAMIERADTPALAIEAAHAGRFAEPHLHTLRELVTSSPEARSGIVQLVSGESLGQDALNDLDNLGILASRTPPHRFANEVYRNYFSTWLEETGNPSPSALPVRGPPTRSASTISSSALPSSKGAARKEVVGPHSAPPAQTDDVVVHALAAPRNWRPSSSRPAPRAELKPLVEQILNFQKADQCFVIDVRSDTEGLLAKSVLAVRLSMLLAESSVHVLMMENNFDFPALHQVLGIGVPRVAGFSRQVYARFQSGMRPPWKVIRCTPHLDVLAEGFIRSPGVALSHEFSEAISELRRAYDFIVADGPTISAFPDSKALDSVSDALIVAVRPGGNPADALARAAHCFSPKRLAAVIFVDVDG